MVFEIRVPLWHEEEAKDVAKMHKISVIIDRDYNTIAHKRSDGDAVVLAHTPALADKIIDLLHAFGVQKMVVREIL